MSLCRQNLILGPLCAIILASCGFSPALQEGQNSSRLHSNTQIEVSGGELGFTLENMLKRNLGGNPESGEYELDVSLSVKSSEGIVHGGTDNYRYHVEGVASFVFRSTEDGEIILRETAKGSASWNSTDQTIANYSAHEHAEERMLQQIADRIHTRLIATTADGNA